MSARAPSATTATVVFAGGGTGGHLYPALAVAQEIAETVPAVECVFLAGDRPVDRRVLDPTGWAWVAQPLPRWSAAPWTWPGTLARFQAARRRCRETFRRVRPGVVIGAGGMASVPAMLEARRAGIPTIVFNPDVLPGRANRLLARRADTVLVQWPESEPYLRGTARVRVTGCPVRARFGRVSRSAGLRAFDLDEDRHTLLVTGASQGARTVNRAVVANLDLIASHAARWQVLHLTGASDHDAVRSAYRGIPAGRVIAYTDAMPEALAAADLVISRAGASTLAEVTVVGRASILMPYPYGRDQHQTHNAAVLEGAGAALRVVDAMDTHRSAPALRRALDHLLADDARRADMAARAARLGRPDAAARVAHEVLQWVDSGARGAAGECLEPTACSARY